MSKKERGLSFLNVFLICVIIILSYGIFHSLSYGDRKEVNYVEIDQVAVKESKVYYYNQLTDGAKIMYTTMLSNIELLKSGNSEINFPYNLNIKDSDFQSAWDAFVMDRPEYFFLDTTNVSLVIRKTTILNKVKINYTLAPSKRDENNNYLPYFANEFNSESEIDVAERIIESERNRIVNGANKYSNLYDKLKYVHDQIVNMTAYNQYQASYNNTIYGLLVKHKCMCQGYANTMKYICDSLDIPCIIVNGDRY